MGQLNSIPKTAERKGNDYGRKNEGNIEGHLRQSERRSEGEGKAVQDDGGADGACGEGGHRAARRNSGTGRRGILWYLYKYWKMPVFFLMCNSDFTRKKS